MAELTDQEMNDHMDEYEDQVSVFPKTTRCDQDHVQNHEKISTLYVDAILVTPCSLYFFH